MMTVIALLVTELHMKQKQYLYSFIYHCSYAREKICQTCNKPWQVITMVCRCITGWVIIFIGLLCILLSRQHKIKSMYVQTNRHLATNRTAVKGKELYTWLAYIISGNIIAILQYWSEYLYSKTVDSRLPQHQCNNVSSNSS